MFAAAPDPETSVPSRLGGSGASSGFCALASSGQASRSRTRVAHPVDREARIIMALS
jgi:hypothetical protein